MSKCNYSDELDSLSDDERSDRADITLCWKCCHWTAQWCSVSSWSITVCMESVGIVVVYPNSCLNHEATSMQHLNPVAVANHCWRPCKMHFVLFVRFAFWGFHSKHFHNIFHYIFRSIMSISLPNNKKWKPKMS